MIRATVFFILALAFGIEAVVIADRAGDPWLCLAMVLGAALFGRLTYRGWDKK